MKSKKNKTRYSFLYKLLFTANIILLILLLLCYLVPFLNPGKFPYLAILGLSYPFILILNILCVLLWLIRGKLAFLYSLVAILVGYQHFLTHFQFHFRGSSGEESEKSLSILTYNVHLFGYFDGKQQKVVRDKIFTFLEQTRADVFCFQEFFDRKGSYPIADTLKTILKTNYIDTSFLLTYREVNQFGLAIYSKYPIINSGKVTFPNGKFNYSIYADIVWHGDTVRVYNNHLESIRFSSKDYSFYEELTHIPTDQNMVKKGSMKIFRKLIRAYGKRAVQVDILRKHISISPYPVILCGDFNDTPLSFTYRKLSSGLQDAFVQKGLGFGKTYSGIFPSYRIDYILFDKKFRATVFKTFHREYSDHYPVLVKLTKEKETAD